MPVSERPAGAEEEKTYETVVFTGFAETKHPSADRRVTDLDYAISYAIGRIAAECNLWAKTSNNEVTVTMRGLPGAEDMELRVKEFEERMKVLRGKYPQIKRGRQ